MSSHALVYFTAGSKKEATQLAALLLEQQLIACANIHGPMTSLYRWEGKKHTSAEYAVIAKTRKSRMPALMKAVKKAHSYDCPCIVALPIVSGYGPFLRWIDEETRHGKPRARKKQIKRVKR